MSAKALIAAAVVIALGAGGLVLFLTTGQGRTVYVQDDATRHREKGEFLLNKRRHTTDRAQKAELLTQAINEFKKTIELKPDFDVAFNMLGHCYIERGQWEDALKSLNQALALRQEYPAALYNRGRVYQQLAVGKKDNQAIDQAIADYQAALASELSANFAGDIHKALSDAYRQKDDLENAIQQLKHYLQKSPHAQDASLVERKIRGLVLMQKGDAPPL